MTYELHFHPKALKEWEKLDRGIKDQFKKILKKRLNEPHIFSAKLRYPLDKCYKIKLRQSGYRLVYMADDDVLQVLVIAVGKRDKNKTYEIAKQR